MGADDQVTNRWAEFSQQEHQQLAVLAFEMLNKGETLGFCVSSSNDEHGIVPTSPNVGAHIRRGWNANACYWCCPELYFQPLTMDK